MKKYGFILAGGLVIAGAFAASFQLQIPWHSPFQEWAPAPVAGEIPSVYLEDLTWLEVDAALKQGRQSVLIPTGGTEQNGPHMVLGKHNKIVRETSRRIAEGLGDILVAPVLAYVPEGSIEPAEGHMKFPGTLTVPEDVFRQTLESAARSLAAHGFRQIYFLGDSGGNQAAQQLAAENLNREFAGKGMVFHAVSDYYGPANGQSAWLLRQGESEASIGRHAGIRDTSELLAVSPESVRSDRLAVDGGGPSSLTGVSGDPTRASAERGRELLTLKVQAAAEEIRRVRRERGL